MEKLHITLSFEKTTFGKLKEYDLFVMEGALDSFQLDYDLYKRHGEYGDSGSLKLPFEDNAVVYKVITHNH